LRGIIEARVMVTNRIKPLLISGRVVHQIGIPFHFGTNGLVTGDSTNDLLPISEEPNVRIMESKALMCDITPGRRPRGKAALEFLAKKTEAA
jgi:formate dehydrogenase major subunit